MNKIQKSDLKQYTLEELLTQNYGKIGTKKRLQADRAVHTKQVELVYKLKKKVVKKTLK